VTGNASRYTSIRCRAESSRNKQGITAMNTTETRTPQVDHDVRVLRNDELDAVIGGGIFQPLSSAVSEVIKNFGAALNTAARAG
jgi:hypothetical protein